MTKPNIQQSPGSTVAQAKPDSLQQPGSAADVIHMYVVEYEHGRNRFHTVVEARSIEAAKRQFRRDNPDVEMLSIV